MAQQPDDGRTLAHDTLLDAMKTRRRFLAGTAAIGASALAGCSGNGGGNGNGNGDGDSATDEPTATDTDTEDDSMSNPDVDVLNYALTLEHLEHAFYRDGLEAFSDQDLQDADTVSSFDDEIRSAVPQRLDTVRAHEKGHVDALTGVVSDLGGEPAGEAEYTFEFDSATKFIATASVLENTGVAAYKGAAPAVKSNDILASALGIHSVEARHASYLNALNEKAPYPEAFDAPSSPDEVTGAANPFFEADIEGSIGPLDGSDEPTADRKGDDDTSDLDVLNFALTLEHLEHAFYRDGLETFDDDQIRNADVLSGFGEKITSVVPDRLKTVRDHEKTHVDALTGTVEDLDGSPVAESEYTFEYESPTTFIQTARVLENVGVAAYAGGAPTVSADAVFGAAAGIHSVEARHAGFLNLLNGESPYPDAVDESMTPEEVLEAADPFFADDMS